MPLNAPKGKVTRGSQHPVTRHALLSDDELKIASTSHRVRSVIPHYAYDPFPGLRAGVRRSSLQAALLDTQIAGVQSQLDPELLVLPYDRALALASLASQCARVLGIARPELFWADCDAAPIMGARTCANPALVVSGSFSGLAGEAEARFLIGHALGLIQFCDTLRSGVSVPGRFAGQVGGALFRALLQPGVRAAYISADRAGLLCARDLGAAQAGLARLCASEKGLLPAARDGAWQRVRRRVAAAALPSAHKRLAALRLFAQSNFYRAELGLHGGEPLSEVDRCAAGLWGLPMPFGWKHA